MLLDNLSLFLRIVEKGGLSVAGREAGLSAATVSERLASLEAYYGATLLTRTTRAISLTEEGKALVDGARRLLAEAEELESRVRHGVDVISGPIRISAPEDIGRRLLLPIIDTFLDEHPAVTIDLNLTDGNLDLVGQGIDFAIRHGLLADSSMRARSLGENRRIVCAAPSYLQENGTPEHPDDLAQHDCIIMRFGQNLDREWPFVIDGAMRKVAVRGRRVVNDGGVVRDWCRQGRGIALKSIRDVDADLASGALVELLADFAAGSTALQIVYPPSAVQPRRVRMLIDRIAKALSTVHIAKP
ncbi:MULTISPECIES: LysR family transcriptional regulator [Rhizobium/Agrobacterium group]|uniref:LysR family transcriptional regulator n=1 Tax=Rhizobium/Agrobacterium group TaxID=227290 RepID=UPI0022CB9922|nr:MULTISPECIES: LysR family transcriptional regulator [Rhizobium/Agrobacterium group]MCZ7482889.1 LysR family transcriptional regulator [Rhizobium rhizogenes]MDA5635002.1 LysR family transcriptional regulator [Agrobacterium sp. ST15.16.024]MDF1890150.1 LysR family transcriptional regulator [Rhizobium rhizogenes]